ncbi:hypothetical protein ACNHUS_22010 [Actinomycetes bacterium M1A6_2h]
MVTRDGFPAPRRAYEARPFTTAFDSGADSRAEYVPDTRAVEDELSTVPDDEPLGELEGRYEWIVGLMSSFTDERLVRWIIAFFTASMGVCATLEIMFGFGATSTIGLGVQVGAAAFAFAAALWWLMISWPRLRTLFVFIMLADTGILAANLSANMPPAYAVGKTTFFVVLGLVAGIFLDRWMLFAHVASTGTAVTAIIGYNMLFNDVPPLGALVVWAPVMSLILAIPALLYAFVRAVRLDQS